MPYAERVYACVTCGKCVIRRAPADAQVRCPDHAIERMVNHMLNMRHKRGADYEKWAAGMARAAAAATDRVIVNRERERRG